LVAEASAAALAVGAGSRTSGGAAQPASKPKISAAAQFVRAEKKKVRTDMGVILLEALGALALLIFIVWWTMFSGRKGGERRDDDRA
jgi:F0F1-type ATP synthase membrane subunit c/vacuolar-type H+-ATPase subunit K